MKASIVVQSAISIFEKVAKKSPDKKVSITLDSGETIQLGYQQLVNELKKLEKALKTGQIRKVKICKDCEYYKPYGGNRDNRGVCWNFRNMERKATDYCSACKEMRKRDE